MAKAKKPVSLELAMGGGDLAPDGVAADAGAAPVEVPVTVRKMTIYVPRAAAKRLKQMALDHECRVNDFLREGVDMMLAKYGQPSLAEFEEK